MELEHSKIILTSNQSEQSNAKNIGGQKLRSRVGPSILKLIATCSCFAVFTLFAPFPVKASTQEVHSCYDAIPLSGVRRPSIKRELYVLVDQTVLFNDALKQEIDKNILTFLQPGDKIVLMSFSAYARGRYPDIVLEGVIDTPLLADQRFYIGKNILAAFDKCLSEQSQGLQSLVASNLQAIFANANGKLPNTALIGTLHFLAEQMIKDPQPAARYILIASDMLEYSDVTSFYSAGTLRLIDPDMEIKRVQKAGLFANFDGAKVYVIGAGFSLAQSYQPTRNIEALETFWRRYFHISEATLEAFGTPSLIGGIGK